MDTRHFRTTEFNCPCCNTSNIDSELLSLLELIRVKFNKRVYINSGYRCKKHNEEVQLEADSNYLPNTSRSQHMYNTAADIVVEDTKPDKVYEFLNEIFPNHYGIGLYNTFLHIDVRKVKARW